MKAAKYRRAYPECHFLNKEEGKQENTYILFSITKRNMGMVLEDQAGYQQGWKGGGMEWPVSEFDFLCSCEFG